MFVPPLASYEGVNIGGLRFGIAALKTWAEHQCERETSPDGSAEPTRSRRTGLPLSPTQSSEPLDAELDANAPGLAPLDLCGREPDECKTQVRVLLVG
jgi:hypothetical protein